MKKKWYVIYKKQTVEFTRKPTKAQREKVHPDAVAVRA